MNERSLPFRSVRLGSSAPTDGWMMRKGGCLPQPEVAERVSSETNNIAARTSSVRDSEG